MAQAITTITFPDPALLEAVAPLPQGITAGLWDLRGDPEGVRAQDIDAVILPYLPGSGWQVLGTLPRLKLVQTQTTGYDGIAELVGPEVAIASAAGVHAAATAELAVGLVLASLRGIDQMVRDQANGVWNSVRRRSLADSRVLLVGVGGIGREIARRLAPFEIELVRVGHTARDDADGHVHGSQELEALAARCDVMIVVTPLNDSTHHLVNNRVLEAMPDGALLVNVARGGVVDSAALTAEVLAGRLKAALDVFDPEPLPDGHPLWQSEDVIISPHVGGNTTAFYPRVVKLLRSQLGLLAQGERPANLVQTGSFG
ncbi:2-hydroxyacid dehydrogenase [Arthrobacter sp. I2-34]|uniref:2-hydroxyacid dehydrogenase n=1 Tax=Arthrobacter hankyongi TaxID=2904801 RepID=A0ABS9L7D8_9MICC|nr:2-hydroxyacid dehydrogenase [Arthrobacter hankyongi]MCG2622394.1 2-hydroxyacid dehydrogenase [Arthrobacter hankyongi]